MRRRYKDHRLQGMYDTCRRLAADPTSELFRADGSPNLSADTRDKYRKGRSGLSRPASQRGSLACAAWQAGVDDLAEFGPHVPTQAATRP